MPLWGQMPINIDISANTCLGTLCIFLGALSVVISQLQFFVVHKRKLTFLWFALLHCTFIQIFLEKPQYTRLFLNNITVYNFTSLQKESAIIAYTKNMLYQHYQTLDSLFQPHINRKFQRQISICLYPSLEAMTSHIRPTDTPLALFHVPKATIFIPIQSIPGSLKHEIVHYFQYEIWKQHPHILLQQQINYAQHPFRTESLAYFLDPASVISAFGFRAEDIIESVRNPNNQAAMTFLAQSFSAPQLGFPSAGISSAEIKNINNLLATDFLKQAAFSDKEAIDIYFSSTLHAENVQQRRRYTHSERAVSYLRYYVTGQVC